MLKKVALTVFLLVTACVIAILAIAGTRPASYHVERQIVTSASPQTVYDLISDLNRFADWSPWQKLDPGMKTSVGGGGVGVGATYYWIGNDEVGEGRMTIMDASPASHVGMKLEFLKPWQATSAVHFRIVPEGEGSRVTWAVDGTNNFMAKVMTLFMSMDSALGRDFENGLANLKRETESAPAAATADSTPADSSVTAKP